MGPVSKCLDRLPKIVAEARQSIFHLWRRNRGDCSCHKTILLKVAKGGCQHFLTDFTDLALQRVEPKWPATQSSHH